jgi:hypothetical protein
MRNQSRIRKAGESARSRLALDALRGTSDVRMSTDQIMALTRRRELLSFAGALSKPEAERLRRVVKKMRKS